MRRFALLLALMIVLSSADSCSEQAAQPSAAAPVEGTAALSPGKVSIEFWYGLGGTMGDTMESTLADFNSSQNEVQVTGVKQADYGETERLLQAAAAAGDVPASFLSSHHFPTTFHERGIIQILDDFIAADGSFNKDDIMEAFMSYCTNKGGQVYSLPVWGTTQVVYYRKDMLEEAGIDPDEMFATWQNVAYYSRTLQEHFSDVENYFGFEPMHGSDMFWDIGASNGADLVSEDQKTVIFDSPEMIEALESVRKWIHEDKSMRTHFGGEGWEYWYKTIDDVMEGRSAGYVGSAGDQGDLDFTKIAAHVQPGFNDHSPNPYVDPIVVGMMAQADEDQKIAAFKLLTYLNQTGTLNFSMATGYMPVRSSARDNLKYQEHIKENPQALVILEQGEVGRRKWTDPTGGGVTTPFADACDLIEIENMPAEEALKSAVVIAQQALDEWWANGGPNAE
jgi:multiple sugar transport system substrate-binding protein